MLDYAEEYFDDPAPSDPKTLNFGSKLFSLLVFGTIAILGSTFAANINLNSGPVEFGQGITQTVACDRDGITLLPRAEFVNSSGPGSFVIKSLVVSEVDSSSNGCQDKTLTFRGFGNTSST